MRILCIDFDGVLHAYTSGWKGVDKVIDGPTPGAMAFLRDAVKEFQVHVYSSRSGSMVGQLVMREKLIEWLIADGMAVDDACDLINDTVKWPTEKPSAFLTLDDRALTFRGEWPTMETLQNFKTWVEVNNDGQREANRTNRDVA